MKRYALSLVAGLLLLGGGLANAADITFPLCRHGGSTVNQAQLQSFTQGTLTPDSNGCVTYDQTKDPNGTDLRNFLHGGWNYQNVIHPSIIGGINKSSTGAQSIIMASPVAMCTTAGTAGALCNEPTWTFSPTGFADTTYSVACVCASVGTNVPIVQAVTKASNTLVVTIAAVTAASASCAEVDCNLFHQ